MFHSSRTIQINTISYISTHSLWAGKTGGGGGGAPSFLFLYSSASKVANILSGSISDGYLIIIVAIMPNPR